MQTFKSKQTIVCLTIVSVFLLFGSSYNHAQGNSRKDQIIVNYTIKNPDYKTIDLYQDKVVERTHKVIPTIRDTIFTDTIFTTKPLSLSFSSKESIKFYGEPGAVINIQLDAGLKLKQRVRFSGDLSEMNNYLLDIEDLESSVGWSSTFNQATPESFMVRLDSVNSAKILLLDKFRKKRPEHPFWKKQEAMIKASAIARRTFFVEYFYMNHQGLKLSDEWRKRIQPDLTFLFSRPELLDQVEVRSTLDNLVFDKSLLLSNKWWTENKDRANEPGFIRPYVYEFGFHYVMDSINNVGIKNFLFYDLVERGFYKGELKPIAKLLRLFYDNCTDEGYIELVKKLESSYKPIQPGELAPEIIGYDVNGKKHSLSDFKGKLVYIDVWATWCGPCIGGFPSFRKLVEAYKNQNIVFIQYSVDEEESSWQSFLRKNDWMGPLCLQLTKESAPGTKIMADYKFSGIPRYMLFDAEGRIINPSIESSDFVMISKILDKYLKKDK